MFSEFLDFWPCVKSLSIRIDRPPPKKKFIYSRKVLEKSLILAWLIDWLLLTINTRGKNETNFTNINKNVCIFILNKYVHLKILHWYINIQIRLLWEKKELQIRQYIFPSGHMTLEQHQNLVEITSWRCSKLNFDVVPTYSAGWVTSQNVKKKFKPHAYI